MKPDQIERYVNLLDEAHLAVPETPTCWSIPRGVVIVGGGERYFPGAYVTICLLRDLGCKLPIELWYLGPLEWTGKMASLLEKLGVTCVDALRKADQVGVKISGGWACKAFAIRHCAFREVLYLDADNIPVRDPEYMFEEPGFLESGAVFWPDFCSTTGPHHRIWRLIGVPYRSEPDFETGQMLIDKSRCWIAVVLVEHLCLKGEEFWWSSEGGRVYGDKDLFRFAWHRAGMKFSMIDTPIKPLDGRGVMCQHDFEGRRLFQHRSLHKFVFWEENIQIDGFWFEDYCLSHLEKLKACWWDSRQLDESSNAVVQAAKVASIGRYRLKVPDKDDRDLELLADGTVGIGATPVEKWWIVREINEEVLLLVGGRDGVRFCFVNKSKVEWSELNGQADQCSILAQADDGAANS